MAPKLEDGSVAPETHMARNPAIFWRVLAAVTGVAVATGVSVATAITVAILSISGTTMILPASANYSDKFPSSQPQTFASNANNSEIQDKQQALIKEALSIPGRDLTPARFVRVPNNTDALGSDYLPTVRAVAKGRTIRFAGMPIPVYVDASAQPDLLPACQSALYMWEARTHELIRFVQAISPDSARVKVYLRHHGFKPGGTPEGAVTHLDWHVRRDGVNRPGGTEQLTYLVEPQVIDINLDVALDRDPDIRPILIRNILAHEMGHALGLLGHSTVKSDLLYKDTDEFSRLSERDLNTLNRLYQQKVDIPL